MELLDRGLEPRDILVPLLDISQSVSRLSMPRALQDVLGEDFLLVS